MNRKLITITDIKCCVDILLLILFPLKINIKDFYAMDIIYTLKRHFKSAVYSIIWLHVCSNMFILSDMFYEMFVLEIPEHKKALNPSKHDYIIPFTLQSKTWK